MVKISKQGLQGGGLSKNLDDSSTSSKADFLPIKGPSKLNFSDKKAKNNSEMSSNGSASNGFLQGEPLHNTVMQKRKSQNNYEYLQYKH